MLGDSFVVRVCQNEAPAPTARVGAMRKGSANRGWKVPHCGGNRFSTTVWYEGNARAQRLRGLLGTGRNLEVLLGPVFLVKDAVTVAVADDIALAGVEAVALGAGQTPDPQAITGRKA